MDIVKKTKNKRCGWGCGEKGTFIQCWWKCKMVQPLWKTVGSFLWNEMLPCGPAILGIYPRQMKKYPYPRNYLYTNVLFIFIQLYSWVPTWKLPKWPLTGELINKFYTSLKWNTTQKVKRSEIQHQGWITNIMLNETPDTKEYICNNSIYMKF